jgi:Protein of unknown function (DUF2867)
MRVSSREHASRSWRIGEVAPDFRLEDAWALPVHGGADDFGTLLEVMASLDPAHDASPAARLLFRVRYRLGDWLGWDEDRGQLPIPGRTETSLRDRLPADLRNTTTDLDPHSKRFRPLYRTHDEWAAELSNRTVHAVMQLTWIEQAAGEHHGQMGVYVKPRGRWGAAYMRMISPFRHWVVYPALLRQIEQAWDARRAERPNVPSPGTPAVRD